LKRRNGTSAQIVRELLLIVENLAFQSELFMTMRALRTTS
jgi:hypothetical protein